MCYFFIFHYFYLINYYSSIVVYITLKISNFFIKFFTMSDAKLIKNIQSTFSMYGFNITRDISTYIARQLKTVSADEREVWLINITDQLSNLNLSTPHITLEHVKEAIKECLRPDDALHESETIFNVINMFNIPKVIYDIDKKKLTLQKVSSELFVDAIHKSSIFRDRLSLLKYVTLKQEPFAPKKIREISEEKYELTSIEQLLSNCRNGDVFVMGILSQLTEGQYYLEDAGGAIKVDLKQATFAPGLIAEGCIVIVNGIYNEGILEVSEIGLPPAEPSADARIGFGADNTFGGPHKTSLKFSEKLKAYEQSHSGDMIVFISDVWLDNSDVLNKLKVIIDGYSEDPPVAFVLCGHFLSSPPSNTSVQKLKEGFTNLAKIIQEYPDVRQYSKFVFVPGPLDLGAPKILPRGPLPKTLLNDFIRLVPGTIFASNPCRIQYCTKEIVVLREDILTKFCRHTLKYPEHGHVWNHYARSIICQSHLAPMNLPVVPVYWKHDHTLQLYPTPDLIVIADQFQTYSTSYSDCKVINPGTFLRSNFAFKVYKPGMNEIEECEVPADDGM
ncbi:DNA polymerase epsilon subunit 2 [Chelonus insularis]|uniref:DNA polymerase epsilon subunit 2 n=1 Tax=Chelonus insularis TaxID=460826 RepID=UPI00158BD225|nr:DNA polymerase epsilon subunit 2 [Chelonus insularis]